MRDYLCNVLKISTHLLHERNWRHAKKFCVTFFLFKRWFLTTHIPVVFIGHGTNLTSLFKRRNRFLSAKCRRKNFFKKETEEKLQKKAKICFVQVMQFYYYVPFRLCVSVWNMSVQFSYGQVFSWYYEIMIFWEFETT